MIEFEFTLKFTLPNAGRDPEFYLESLGENCDDAMMGIGQSGRIGLNFIREAQSAFVALASAIADVKCAIPGAKLIEAKPDLVGLTDVADIVGCSRQNMRKMMVSGGSKFPAPVHEGKSALWRLAKVLQWLKKEKHYQVDNHLMEVAQTTMQFNIVKDAIEVDSATQKQIQQLVS